MELINKNYIIVDKYDIYNEQLNANEQNDKFKIKYFNKLFHALREYEKEERIFIKDVYMDLCQVFRHIFLKDMF